ncbi:MAG: hypothetical protein ABSF77_17470 [Spirochaetia bacterium]
MEAGGRLLFLLIIAVLFAASCASEPPKAASPPVQQQPVAQTAPAEPTAQATEPAPQPAEQPAATEFVASEELYKKTFDEVQEVIAALTKIISASDYEQWLTYLTADYVATTGSPAFLSKASNAAVLKKNGIVLKNLKDYFDNVVVRSHLQATLSDIQFVDATHVKAITKVQGTPVILYYLVREEGRWKVGLQQAEEN